MRSHAVRRLSPSFDAIPGMVDCIGEQEYYFNRMTNEQSNLLDFLEEQQMAVIQGGAGTGKTMLALEKAKRLSNDDAVLFLCFNKYLLEYLKTNYSSLMPNVFFYNIPSLACSHLSASTVSDELTTDFLNNFERYQWRYKHIIVDEAQDFRETHLTSLAEIAQLNEGCFYAFYDKNQLVQQRNDLKWAENVECRLVLKMNCRNTMSIATTSNAPIGVEKVQMRRDVIGQTPNFYVAGDDEKALSLISDIIRGYTDNGVQRKQIVILTTKKESNSILTNKSSIGTYPLTNNRIANGIFFTTARKFKGLESDVVIMVDIDDESFESDEARRVLYVGASRAKHFLDFVAVLDDSKVSRLGKTIPNTPGKKVGENLAEYLKVKIISALQKGGRQ
jgi:DNA helicase IV